MTPKLTERERWALHRIAKGDLTAYSYFVWAPALLEGLVDRGLADTVGGVFVLTPAGRAALKAGT